MSGGNCAGFGALSMDGLCRHLRRAFPTATAAHVGQMIGAPASTVEKWLRGETRPSAGHLAALIGALGPGFLAEAMPKTRAWTARAARHERLGEIIEEAARLLAAE